MRLLEKATPRVKVFTIGKTEEGREMIAVAVASEGLMAKLDQNRARLAKLADPRTIKLDDAEADETRGGLDADLLHHRHDPLHRDRRADGAHGTGLPPGRGRQPLHQGTSANTSSRSSRRSSRWTAATAWWTSTSGTWRNPGQAVAAA